MQQNKPVQIKVSIYPNQLEWMDQISERFRRSRRHTFLECFACYIGEFKQAVGKEDFCNGR